MTQEGVVSPYTSPLIAVVPSAARWVARYTVERATRNSSTPRLMFSLQGAVDYYRDVIDWADIAQSGVHKMFSEEARGGCGASGRGRSGNTRVDVGRAGGAR